MTLRKYFTQEINKLRKLLAIFSIINCAILKFPPRIIYVSSKCIKMYLASMYLTLI